MHTVIVVKYDVGQLKLCNTRYMGWKARLSLAVNRPMSRLTFQPWHMDIRRQLHDIKVKASVYADNHGFTGTTAYFGGY